MILASMAIPIALKVADEIKAMRTRRAPYGAAIHEAALKHGVSVSILSALLWVESGYDPDAIGSAGEVGMGQMLAIAASDVNTTQAALKMSPVLQIDKAAQFLRLMIDRADGDVLLGVRGYNAGLRRAKDDPSASIEYGGRVLGLAMIDYLLEAIT